MQYIDKTVNENSGTQIVNNLLEQCWADDKYLNANYETLSKPEFRQPFIAILLNEQKDVCCYCMKQLGNNNKTTLEHIIPHKSNLTDFNKYTSSILINNVVHKDLFVKNFHLIPPPKYPHDIAYHNLVASCDSKSNCNNYREDDIITPFFYDAEVVNKIEYDIKGNAYSYEYLHDLATAGISTSPELIIFREIWHKLSKQKESPDDVTDDDILEVVATMQIEKKFERKLNDFWDSPSKRPDLLKYKWFFFYYKNS
jgi:hypothetical protein